MLNPAARLPRHACRVLSRALACALLAGAAPYAMAEDHPPAPAPAPGGNPPVAQPQPLPLRQSPPAPVRPRQVVEVIPVENADALAAKLRELVESGLFITAVTAITANGQPAVVVVGMPQPVPAQRPPMIQPQPRPLPLGAPGGVPPAGSPPPPAQQAPPPPPPAPPAPAKP